ncbi:hypothetical protein ACLKA7_001693 [Drosophila subpalustris]
MPGVSTNILDDDDDVDANANVDVDVDVDVVYSVCRLLAALLNRFAIFLHVFPAVCTIWQPVNAERQPQTRAAHPTDGQQGYNLAA